jgi:hypothetical protein
MAISSGPCLYGADVPNAEQALGHDSGNQHAICLDRQETVESTGFTFVRRGKVSKPTSLVGFISIWHATKQSVRKPRAVLPLIISLDCANPLLPFPNIGKGVSSSVILISRCHSFIYLQSLAQPAEASGPWVLYPPTTPGHTVLVQHCHLTSQHRDHKALEFRSRMVLYFQLCFQYWKEAYVCYRSFRLIAQANLAAALQYHALSGDIATTMLEEITALGQHHVAVDEAVVGGLFDVDRGPHSIEDSRIVTFAKRFEDFRLFNELTTGDLGSVLGTESS